MRFFLKVLLVAVLAFFFMTPAAHADGFWDWLFGKEEGKEKSVSEGEKYGLSKKQAKIQKERMDDCGRFDVGCKLNAYFLNLGEQLIAFAMNLLKKFVVKPNQILEDPVIKKYFGYFEEFSWTLLTVFFIFHLIRILATNITESNSEFKMLLRKLVFTALIIGSIPWIIKKLLTMNNYFVNGVLDDDIVISNFVGGLFLTATSVTSVVPILLILSWAILLLILSVQFTVRFAKIALLFILGPLAAATNLNSEINLFQAWWRDLLSTIFTQAIQMLLLVLAIKMFTGVTLDNLIHFVGATGFLIMILKTPEFLKEWIWSSGARGMTQQAGGAAMRFTQKALIRRG